MPHRIEIFGDGQPCTHPGCASHLTHACEVCGRKGAKGVATVAAWILALPEERVHKMKLYGEEPT